MFVVSTCQKLNTSRELIKKCCLTWIREAIWKLMINQISKYLFIMGCSPPTVITHYSMWSNITSSFISTDIQRVRWHYFSASVLLWTFTEMSTLFLENNLDFAEHAARILALVKYLLSFPKSVIASPHNPQHLPSFKI